MPLIIVPTQIGDTSDVSPRCIKAIRDAEIVILEEFSEGSKTIKALGIARKQMYQLNEHSDSDDIKDLLELCKTKNTVLISDCGTPNFCDPGAVLIKACRKANILVNALPGPSSLMLTLSLSSERLDQFLFRGFLPAKNELRASALKELKSEKKAVVLMDTPYRIKKLIEDVANLWPHRHALLCLNLTLSDQQIFEGTCKSLMEKTIPDRAEFMLLVYSEGFLSNV